jgi:hypothetical protein
LICEIRRETERCAAIESVIGHFQSDHNTPQYNVCLLKNLATQTANIGVCKHRKGQIASGFGLRA